MSQEPIARTVTESGNIIYQRTQQGYFETIGLWAIAFVLAFLFLTTTLPLQEPYLDTAAAALLLVICGWRLLMGSRQMLVAIGENHLQYIGQGRAWYFYFKDLLGVDVEDPRAAISLSALFVRRSGPPLPRRLVFYMHNGNRVIVRLTYFDAPALLIDLDKRLPRRVERSERYQKALDLARSA